MSEYYLNNLYVHILVYIPILFFGPTFIATVFALRVSTTLAIYVSQTELRFCKKYCDIIYRKVKYGIRKVDFSQSEVIHKARTYWIIV